MRAKKLEAIFYDAGDGLDIMRREDGNIDKVALELNPQGNYGREGSPHGWRRTRMRELKTKNITWMECKETEGNRTRGKALLEDLCATQERRGQTEIFVNTNKSK